MTFTVRPTGRPVVEGVRTGGRRLDPVELQPEVAERRRQTRERMDRRADVVTEAGQRQLGGPRAASDRVACFDDEDRASGLRKRDGGGEPVRAGADDDGV